MYNKQTRPRYGEASSLFFCHFPAIFIEKQKFYVEI